APDPGRHVPGVLRDARGDPNRVPQPLVPHRRPRPDRRRRRGVLRRPQGRLPAPARGERLVPGGRGGHPGPPVGRRRGGLRGPGRRCRGRDQGEPGRRRRGGHRPGGGRRVLRAEPALFRGAALPRGDRRAAPDPHRAGAEVPAPRGRDHRPDLGRGGGGLHPGGPAGRAGAVMTTQQDRPVTVPPVTAGRGGPSFQELLDTEDRPVPGVLRRAASADLGVADIGFDRYLSPDWHRLEVERVWKRVWQMACREEDIPGIGDTTLYDVADISLLLVRTDDGIRAYHNSCLHRGRPLRTEPGTVQRLRCPFHGFTWALDGTLTEVPTAWDFEHLDRARACLPQAHVDTWAGWVFVNVADHPAPLHEQLGGIVEHWRGWETVPRAKALHLVKPLPCNWKLALEAFLESYHTLATHPQLLASLDEVNTEYDVY